MGINVEGVVTLLQVYDMRRSLRFYRDGLGFSVANTSEPGDDCNWAMLRQGDATIMLNTAYDPGTRPPAPDTDRTKAHGDTMLYFGCRELDACYEYLTSLGVRAEPPRTTYYGMRQVITEDPDGYGLCFQWPVSSRTQSEHF